MTFNYRAGLFRMWLVTSLFWVVVSVWAGLAIGPVIAVPLGFGIVLGLIVWAIRGFAAKQPTSPETFDLGGFRKHLAETQGGNPELHKLEPFLTRLEAKYGNNVPKTELEGLRQLVSSRLRDIDEQRQEIINRTAEEGKTVEIESLRRSLERSGAALTGIDRDAYVLETDKLLDSLTAKYGSRIPVDHAHKIMQDLEAGRGYAPDE
jgi:hypothetical protein